MVALSSNSSVFGQLVHEAEKLRPSEFEQFVVRILGLNTSRKSNGLMPEESSLLKNINKEFPTKKWEQFLLLDDRKPTTNPIFPLLFFPLTFAVLVSRFLFRHCGLVFRRVLPFPSSSTLSVVSSI